MLGTMRVLGLMVLFALSSLLPAQTLELRNAAGEIVTELRFGTRETGFGFVLKCSDGLNRAFRLTTTAGWLGAASLPEDINMGTTPAQVAVSAYPWNVAFGGTYTASLRIEAPDGSGIAPLVIPATLHHGNAMFIQTGAVPDATPGGAYFSQLKAYGGSGTYTWSITAGSLPTGITLASDFLSGTAPGTEGVYPFTMAARDENGTVVTKEFTLAVRRGPLRVATFYLPEASIGHPYVGEQQQSVLLESLGGGVTGHTWSLAAGSQLPAGLTLSPQGVLSGTPSGALGANTFTVTVADGAGASASKTLAMVVLPEMRAAFGSMLPSAVPNQPYAVTLGATGGFGKDYRFSSQGAMPPGIAVSVVPVTGIPATYRISGTPTVAGTYSFDIEIANGPLRKRQRVQLTVGAPRAPLQIVTDSLPEGQVAVGYSQPLSAEGGSGTGYVWSVNGIALSAAGLALANNIIQGIPVASGTFQIPLTVTDSLGGAASKTLALTVRPGTAPRIMTSALPGG